MSLDQGEGESESHWIGKGRHTNLPSRVLKETVVRIEHFMREKKEPFPVCVRVRVCVGGGGRGGGEEERYNIIHNNMHINT